MKISVYKKDTFLPVSYERLAFFLSECLHEVSGNHCGDSVHDKSFSRAIHEGFGDEISFCIRDGKGS